MKISVYRVYPRGASANADSQHLFSIVTTDESAHYATPNIANSDEWEAFDDARIEQALKMEETRPTSSLDWALVASIGEAVSSEKKIAAKAWTIRNESAI